MFFNKPPAPMADIKVNELQLQREKMAKWNTLRAKAEEKGLAKFYKLRELFHPPKEVNK